MDVGDIKVGRVDRGPERPAKGERAKVSDGVQTPVSDSAAISQDGRDTLAAVEALAERAAKDEPDRREFVERVRALVREGRLDDERAYRESARRILSDGGF